MPTLVDLDSFAHHSRGAAVAAPFVGIYQSVGTLDPSFDLGVTRTVGHVASLKIAQNGSQTSYASRTVPTGNRLTVGSIYFRVDTAPSVQSTLLHATGPTNAPQFNILTDGKLRAWFGANQQDTAGSVADGQWHLLDWRADVSTSTFTMDWTLDGVAQTQTSRASQTPADFASWRFGSPSAGNTLTAYLQDYVLSVTSGDYPIGPHLVKALYPTGDGTHNLNGHITNATSGTTNLYQSISDWNGGLPDTATYLTQNAIGASDYAEVTLSDPAEGTIWDVGFIMAAYADGVNADTADLRFVDSGGTTIYSTGLLDYSVSTTVVGYHREILARPGAGWDATIAGTKVRWGFSTDATPLPRLSAVIVEYASPENIAPPLIDQTAATFAPSVSSGAGVSVSPGTISNLGTPFTLALGGTSSVIITGLIDQSAVAIAPTSIGPDQLVIITGDTYEDLYTDLYGSAGVIVSTGTPFAPSLDFGGITLPLIDQTGVPFDLFVLPDISITINPIDQTGVPFDGITVTFGAVASSVSPTLIDSTGTTFAPLVRPDIIVQMPIIGQVGITFAPAINGSPVVPPVPPPAAITVPVAHLLLSFTDPLQAPEWFDESAYLRSFSFTRGKGNEFDQVGTGTLRATLDNRDGRYDPTRVGGPWYGSLLPLRRMRLQADVGVAGIPFTVKKSYTGKNDVIKGGSSYVTLFDGYIEEFPQQWSLEGPDATTEISAVDGLGLLQAAEIPEGVTIQGTTGDAVERLVSQTFGWPDVEFDVGSITLRGNVAVTGSYLAALQKLSLTEGGTFFMSKEGVAVFQDAAHGHAVVGIWGDAAGEYPYRNITDAGVVSYLFNEITVKDSTLTAENADPDSISRFNHRSKSFEVFDVGQNDLDDRAENLVGRYSTPLQRISDFAPTGKSVIATWQTILKRELGDGVRVKRRTPAGNLIDRQGQIQGIGIDSPRFNEWNTTWNIADVPELFPNLLTPAQGSFEGLAVGSTPTFWHWDPAVQGNQFVVVSYPTSDGTTPASMSGTQHLLVLQNIFSGFTGLPMRLISDPIPIEAGMNYRAGVSLAGGAAQANLLVRWLDAASVIVDQDVTPLTPIPDVFNWTRLRLEAPAPSNAVTAVLVVTWADPGIWPGAPALIQDNMDGVELRRIE